MRNFLVIMFLLVLPLCAAAQGAPQTWKMELKAAKGPVSTYFGEAVYEGDRRLTLRFTGAEPGLTTGMPPITAHLDGSLSLSEGGASGGFQTLMPLFIMSAAAGIVSADQATYQIDGASVDYQTFLQGISDRPVLQFLQLGSIFGHAAQGTPIVPDTKGTPQITAEILQVFEGAEFDIRNPVLSRNGTRIEWDWTYRVTGLNGREVSGGPAQGTPLIWQKTPRIEKVFVANAQAAKTPVGAVLYPKPREVDANLTVARPGPEFTRDLIVIGENLGALEGQTPTPLGDTDMSAVIYGPVEPFVGSNLVADLFAHDPAAPRHDVILAATKTAASGDKDVMRIGLDIAGDVGASTQAFQVGGTGGAWFLRYGETLGQIGILRPRQSAFVPAEDGGHRLVPQTSQQPASYVFREEVMFAAQLDTQIDSPTIQIVLNDPYGAPAPPETNGGGPREITLTRLETAPRLYRSDSFVLADREFWQDADAVKAFNSRPDRPDNIVAETYDDIPRDRVVTAVRDQALSPDFAPGQYITRIAPLPDGPVRHADPSIRGDYLTALKVAHTCRSSGKTDIDWDKLSLETSDALSLNLLPGLTNELRITYGQHAALLLARARLLDIIEQDDVAGLVTLWEAGRRNPDLPQVVYDHVMGRTDQLVRLSIYPSFENLFAQKALFHGLENMDAAVRDRILTPHVDLAYTILNTFITARANALNILRTTRDCDVLGLVKVGVDGIDPIIQTAASELTRAEIASGSNMRLRRPDTVGRREMLALPDLFARYEIRRDWQDQEWLYIKGAITVAGLALGGAGIAMGLAGVTEAGIVSSAALAADALDFTAACTDAYCGATEASARRALAQSAAGQLGTARLDKVRKDVDFSAINAALDVAMAGTGALFAAKDLAQARASVRFGKAADDILTAAAKAAKSTQAEQDAAQLVVKKFFDQVKRDPSALERISDLDRSAMITLLSGNAKGTLPGDLRAFLRASMPAPTNASTAAAFIEKAGGLATDGWDVKNLSEIQQDLRAIEAKTPTNTDQ